MVFFLYFGHVWADEPVSEQTRTRQSAELRQLVDMGVPETVAAKMQSRFKTSQMVQVRSIVQAAEAQGLPIEPLADKVLEGIAKNVSADRIVQAMEQVRSRYAAAVADAREITPTRARQQALTRTMAQAMAAGMPPEALETITNRLRSRGRTMTQAECDQLAETAFTAARDMARMGASGEVVAETVNLALDDGYTAEQMQRMRSQFMHQARQIDADMVANQFRERVRAGQDVADDATMGGGSGAGSGYGNSGGKHGDGGGSDNGGNNSGSGNSGSNSGNGGGTGSGSGSEGGSGSGSGSGSGNSGGSGGGPGGGPDGGSSSGGSGNSGSGGGSGGSGGGNSGGSGSGGGR
jgi:hypothetical protein